MHTTSACHRQHHSLWVLGRRKHRRSHPPASPEPPTESAVSQPLFSETLSSLLLQPEPSHDIPHFPFICNITYTVAETFICGGILVDASYVATAAHCVDSINLSSKKQKLTVSCDNAAYVSFSCLLTKICPVSSNRVADGLRQRMLRTLSCTKTG